MFHWPRVYGGWRRKATAEARDPTQVLLDSVFMMARAASVAVFEADSRVRAAQQAKFEHVCPWAAVVSAALGEEEKRLFLEGLVDRFEIGLRESGAVSDMKVGVKVRDYAAAMHGRLLRYARQAAGGDWDAFGKACAEHGVGREVVDKVREYCEKGLAERRQLGYEARRDSKT